jgi:hypothetical protein
MKPLFSAILALLFLVPAPSTEASSRMSVARATTAHQGNALRCRRIQRAAQSVIAGQSLQAYEGLHQRIAKKPRRLVKSMVGYAHKRGEVTRGCFRCIARQFVHRVPVALQAPCGIHSPCIAGGKLDAEADACAALVCTTKPECCSTEWTADCVESAKSVCDLNCSGCLHDVCETGAALDTTCDPCAAQICESDTFCCDTEWTEECVGQVASVCQTPCDGTTTVPQGTTTTIDAATTTSLPAGTTIPGATTTTVSGATTTTIVGPTTTLGSPTTTLAQCDENVIDFEDQPAGTNLSATTTSQGQPVTIKGNNPKLPNLNAALLYDSSCTGGCTGQDFDLGTPNEDFGGPGIGDGGANGSPTQNDEALVNLLIVATNLTDANNDTLVDTPNDQKNTTTTREIDFSSFAPVSVLSLKLIDVGDTEGPAKIELFDQNGSSITSANAGNGENNGVEKITMPPNQNVWKMVITMHGSGGVDDIQLSCPTTTTTQPPVTTTTIGGGTTTTVPATTTTIGGGTTTTIGGGTTTTVPATTTTIGATTTTVPATTTTTTPAAAACPNTAELTLLAQTREACANNADCEFGTCNSALGRCQTQTELDTGWTGIAHDADITDNVVILGNLSCPNNDGGPTCGQCTIEGINPEPGNCRCQGANQTICDEPFVADQDDCAGAICNCYLGPPLALSAGNTPACVVNRFAEDVSGTTNVDTGDSLLTAHLRSQVFLGILLNEPCPYCTGDPTANDGVKGGKCVDGLNDGDDCDAQGINRSFPAPGGDGHSLDCFPNSPNVSGAGLIINLNQTTGTSTLNSNIPCGPSGVLKCPCGICSNDVSTPCSSNTDCTSPGVCQSKNQSEPVPNQCNNACVDIGSGEGQCDASGPDDLGCDGISKANGESFIACTSNADCDPANIGIDGGACTQTKRRECFLPTITATGTADPTDPVGVATFCIPATANTGINLTAGLPGPGRVQGAGHVVTRCDSATYTPNVGCP